MVSGVGWRNEWRGNMRWEREEQGEREWGSERRCLGGKAHQAGAVDPEAACD